MLLHKTNIISPRSILSSKKRGMHIFISFTLLLFSSLKCCETPNNFVTLKLADEREYQMHRNNPFIQYCALLKKWCAKSSGPLTVQCPTVTRAALSHLKKIVRNRKYVGDRLSDLRKKNRQDYNDVILAAEYLQTGKEAARSHVDFLWDHTITPEGSQELQTFYTHKEKFPSCTKLLEKKIKQCPLVVQKQHIAVVGTHQNVNYLLDYSPTGDGIALAASDSTTVKIFGAGTQQLFNNEWPTTSLKYSPCGKELATIAENGVLRIWNIETQQLRYDQNNKTESCCFAYTNDGNCLVKAYKDSMFLFDLRSNISMAQITTNVKDVTAVCWGSAWYLLTGHENGSVSVLDARNGYKDPLHIRQAIKHGGIKHIEKAHKPNLVAIGAYLWNFEKNKTVITPRTGLFYKLNFAPGGHSLRMNFNKMFLVDKDDKDIVGWETRFLKAIAVHPQEFKIAAVHSNGEGQQNLVVWNTRAISHGTVDEAISSYNNLLL
jgi:WD40 repeat protein